MFRQLIELLLNLVIVTIQQQEAERERAETNRRFEESRQQPDEDRALMLQLIQVILRGGMEANTNLTLINSQIRAQ